MLPWWIRPGIFKEKLVPIVNGMRTNSILSPPIGNCVCRNAAPLCNLIHGKHPSRTKPIEATLESVGRSNVADGWRCQRQAVACFEAVLVENASHVRVVVIVQEAIKFGYHCRILLVTFAETQRPRQYKLFRHAPRKRTSSCTCSPFPMVTSSMRRRTIRLRSRSAVAGSFHS